MEASKKYTWTVSVIAMLDRDEVIEERLVQWDAYNEFEESITSINRANKDIQFVIYLYDVKDKRAYLKKSSVVRGRYQLDTISFAEVPNFYAKGYPHLVSFFKEHVAKKELEEGEEHKQFLIVWGHAAGLGFLKQKIEQEMELARKKSSDVEKSLVISKPAFRKYVKKEAGHVYCYNYLRSQLSIKQKDTPKNVYTNNLRSIPHQGNGSLEAVITLSNEESFEVITAGDLSEILKKGLRNDKSVCTVQSDTGEQLLPGVRIQVMLCLSCYVNMIETGYALRNIVNVYIAPSTHISHYGYNYYKLFKLLSRHPETTEREIAINITDYYLAKYFKKSIRRLLKGDFIYEVDYRNSVAFSAVYLHKYDGEQGAIEKIKNFTTRFELFLKEKANDKSVQTVIQVARRKCAPTSRDGRQEIGIVDYQNFLAEVFDSLGKLKFEEDVFFSKDEQIIARYYPGKLADSRYDSVANFFTSQSPGSFSIFLPDRNSDIEKALLNIYLLQGKKNEFLQKTKWHRIIDLTK
jgi:hypothetical protein